jgi:hypothetical protein
VSSLPNGDLQCWELSAQLELRAAAVPVRANIMMGTCTASTTHSKRIYQV